MIRVLFSALRRVLPVFVPICLMIVLSACETPISGSLRSDIVTGVSSPGGGDNIFVQGLKASKANFANAKRVGALNADDPAEACVDSVLKDLGVGQPGSESFTPEVVDILSAGSVLYIRARQLEREANSPGLRLSFDCKALIGQIVIDAGKVARRVGSNIPGVGVIGRILD